MSVLAPRRLRYGEEASTAEHLDELRDRLLIIGGAVLLGTAVAFAFHSDILGWLNQPLPPGRRRTLTLGVAEPFTVSLTVSLYAGLLIATPVSFWQIWSFLAPAISASSTRRAGGLAAAATVLAVAGFSFAYFVLLPRAVHWLTSYDSRQFVQLVQAKPYYSFVTTVLVGVVLVFEMPLVVVGLVYISALTPNSLRRNRRIGYFVVAVVALGLPGPDPITTALELIPMWVLFEGSIWLAVLTEHRRRQRDGREFAPT